MAPALFRETGATWQTACKPNSVEDGHSSRRRIAARARATYPEVSAMLRLRESCSPRWRAGPARIRSRSGRAANFLPIWSCSVWGLPCLRRYRRSGALLPHLFTLTRRGERYILCGTSRLAALKPRSRTLSGTLPCGVRTFLSRTSLSGSGRPACLHLIYVSADWLDHPLNDGHSNI